MLFNFNVYFSPFVSFAPSLRKRTLGFQTDQRDIARDQYRKRLLIIFDLYEGGDIKERNIKRKSFYLAHHNFASYIWKSMINLPLIFCKMLNFFIVF